MENILLSNVYPVTSPQQYKLHLACCTGYGDNDEFGKIISSHGIDYARQNFCFALLEHRTMKTDDNVIIQREKYWKDILLTRGEYGYNKN